jgi:hypothetical protein
MIDLSHAGLCALAAKWLKRSASQNGHGCAVAVTEAPSGWNGEIPDAVGFRISGHQDGSVMVEVKVSRSDFLADKMKPHRATVGIGNWRYFMCPEGIIQPSDLPDGWGLLWVNPRGHIKPMAGAAAYFSCGYGEMVEKVSVWRQESDTAREMWLLIKLLSRVGDAEQMNRWIREANTERGRIAKEADRLRADNERLKRELRLSSRMARTDGETAIHRTAKPPLGLTNEQALLESETPWPPTLFDDPDGR